MRTRLDRQRTGGRRAVLATALACLCVAAPAAAVTSLSDPEAPTRPLGSRTLTSDTGGWLCAPPGSCTFSYAWQRCTGSCVTVPGAGGPKYLLSTPDIGTRIRSVVTATDTIGSEARPSAQTATIAAAPPVNISPPSASGRAQVGFTLTSAPGTWDDPSLANVTYSHAWLRCATADTSSCGAVSAAPTYALGAADVGSYIRRRETAEGLGAATAVSLPLGGVLPAPVAPPPRGVPFSGSGSPASKPRRRSRLRRLRPFPVIVIAGRLHRGRTRITGFVVRGPRGARVRLRCRGRGCPFRRLSHRIGRRKKLRVRRAQRSYRPRTVLTVTVTGRNRIGKYTRVRFRRRGAPARRDLCLRPRARRPSRCPR